MKLKGVHLSDDQVLEIITKRLTDHYEELSDRDFIVLISIFVDVRGIRKGKQRAAAKQKPTQEIVKSKEEAERDYILYLEKGKTNGQQHPIGQGREIRQEDKSPAPEPSVQGT